MLPLFVDLISAALEPLVNMTARRLKRCTSRVFILDPFNKVFDMLPVRLVRAKRKNLVLLGSVLHSFFFGLTKRLHPGQLLVGLLMQILAVVFIFSTHCRPPFKLMVSRFFHSRSYRLKQESPHISPHGSRYAAKNTFLRLMCVGFEQNPRSYTFLLVMCPGSCSILSPVPPPFLLFSRQLKVAVASGLPRSPAPNFDNDVLG